MWLNLIESFLLALSLCADCFAVSACSSVSIKKIDWRSVGAVSLVFALVQSAFFALGWLLGDTVAGMVEKLAHLLGFLLLLYVGGYMIWEGIRRQEEARNLNGFVNILIGAVATSIDALAVGVSISMGGKDALGMTVTALAIFVVTFATVVLGMYGGHAAGKRFGHIAEILGGLVLIAIGVGIVLS